MKNSILLFILIVVCSTAVQAQSTTETTEKDKGVLSIFKKKETTDKAATKTRRAKSAEADVLKKDEKAQKARAKANEKKKQ